MNKKYLKPKEVSARLDISINTLRKHRHEGRGLPFVVIGRKNKRDGTVLYPADKVEECLNRSLVNAR